MFQIDGTLIVVFLSFLVFMVLMKSLFFDPMLSLKTERAEKIENSRQLVAQSATERAALEQTTKERLAEANRQAQQIINEKRQVAKQSANTIVQEARVQAQQSLDAATQVRLEQQEATYQALAQSQVDDFAQMIVAKVQGKQLSSMGGRIG